MYNLCPHHRIHRILVPKPVLAAPIDHTTVRTFDHIPTRRQVSKSTMLLCQVPRRQAQQNETNTLAELFKLTQTRHTLPDPSRESQWRQMFWVQRWLPCLSHSRPETRIILPVYSRYSGPMTSHPHPTNHHTSWGVHALSLAPQKEANFS